jgi:tripartite-type tricarboxylate transporter receptor subunit TctC
MTASRPRASLAPVCAVALMTLAAAPAAAAEFYAGKTIERVVGSDVGGGYDIYARAIARHLPRHIPGQPTIVAKNQPGAGSSRAAAYIYSVAPKDGTVIGAVFPGVIIAPLLQERVQASFDPAKLQFLASADSATRVCATYERSGIKTFADALQRKAIMGASAVGASTRDYANMHRKSSGALFEVVSGYKGTADILLAMERGEVDGLCGWDWSSLKSQRPDWLRDRKVNVLVQVNAEAEDELTRLGVPPVWQFVKEEIDRRAVELIIGQQVFGRPFIAPPGVPAAQIATLRSAFAATLQDKQFLADAEKLRIDVNPSSGRKVQETVEKLYATPKLVVERARELVKP